MVSFSILRDHLRNQELKSSMGQDDIKRMRARDKGRDGAASSNHAYIRAQCGCPDQRNQLFMGFEHVPGEHAS